MKKDFSSLISFERIALRRLLSWLIGYYYSSFSSNLWILLSKKSIVSEYTMSQIYPIGIHSYDLMSLIRNILVIGSFS